LEIPGTDFSRPLDRPAHDPIHSIVSRQAGDAVAIEHPGGRWTYAELSARARGVAEALRSAGIQPATRVVVTGTRSPGFIASMLGIWEAGGVVVPIAEHTPAHRCSTLIERARAKLAVVVGTGGHLGDLAVVSVDPSTGAAKSEAPAGAAAATESSTDESYVFFTSGTTGLPKGVLGSHQGLAHFLRWQRETFEIGRADRAAQLTGVAFDVVLRDMLTVLGAGGTLCFPPVPTEQIDAKQLARWLRDAKITMLHSVPSLMEAWVQQWRDEPKNESVRLVFMAGEPLTDVLVARLRNRFPKARVVNLYGPTETTLAKLFYVVPDAPVKGTQPIGRPLPNVDVTVLDAHGKRTAIGDPGEIVIRTPFRTLGYLDGEERSGQRFRPNPFGTSPDDIVYFTGDRGRLTQSGDLEILGRMDDQVKIRGVRVEPVEVAAVIRTHPAVTACFVSSFKDAQEQTALCAYVVLTPEARSNEPNLRQWTSERLPIAMVPTLFLPLEKMPLTPNGKVDRAALPPPERAPKKAAKNEAAPSDDIAGTITAIWKDVLAVDEIEPTDNFFDLGGHSLNATQIVARLRDAFGVTLSVRTLFESPTVAELVEKVVDAVLQRASSEQLASAMSEKPHGRG